MKKTALLVLPALVAVLVAFLPLGCDDDSSLGDQSFRIEPQEVTLAQGDTSLSLSVVGGQPPFEWVVGDENLGTVSTGSRTVIYSRTAQNGANVVEVTDGQTWTAKAVITQQDDPDPLAISPTDVSLDDNGDKVAFSGTGGTYPYRWSVGNSARGHLDSTSGSQAVYTRDTAENNTVILTDKKGHVAIANVTQPDVPSLSVSPSTASVATNGGTVVLSAVGGTAPYTWSHEDTADGTLPTPPTGPSIVYTSNSGGQDIIRVTDGNGSYVFATITKN